MDPKNCIEPGCPQEAVVGLNGAWVCLDHFAARLESLKAALRMNPLLLATLGDRRTA